MEALEYYKVEKYLLNFVLSLYWGCRTFVRVKKSTEIGDVQCHMDCSVYSWIIKLNIGIKIIFSMQWSGVDR